MVPKGLKGDNIMGVQEGKIERKGQRDYLKK